jgi:hypothetical protein
MRQGDTIPPGLDVMLDGLLDVVLDGIALRLRRQPAK